MSKVEQIQNSLNQALKLGDSIKVSTFRLIISELKNFAIEQRVDFLSLSDDQVLKVLEKQAKQRNDSIDAFKKANRQDLVEKEQAELDIIQTLLPQKLSEEQTYSIVQDLIAQLNITQMSQMGQLMGEISKKYGASIDKGLVSKIVKEKFS